MSCLEKIFPLPPLGFVLSFSLLFFPVGYLSSQGITSATITGRVFDDEKTPLFGAHAILVHIPTASNYGSISREDGRFNFQNLKVGGPYQVTLSFLGFEDQVFENIFLRLGQEHLIEVNMVPSSLTLGVVEVIAPRQTVFSEDRTGAATNVTTEQLEALPTIKRSLTDYTRLIPQASTLGQGISFVGMNNRYNNFSIDGTVNNDVFGLSGLGTNGGQTGTEPISLDAIEEIQVEVAPFDVRFGGFTGGSINAVTRSGTNDIVGSAYFYVNNHRFSGKLPPEVTSQERLPPYFERTLGFRLGAPVKKDELFLFINLEHTKREDPTLFNVGSGSAITLPEAQRVENKLIELSGDNQGGYLPFTTNKLFNKFFTRLDWTINNHHRLTLRHNYVFAREISLARREDFLQFNNTAINFPSKTNSTVMELFSRLGGNKSNELRIGFTRVIDNQNITGTSFPYISIEVESGADIVAGSGRLFTADKLEQSITTLTDHFTFFKANHIITLGTHNEFYGIKHLNITDNFGTYFYAGIDNFELIGTDEEVKPVRYQHSYSKIPGQPHFAPEFKAVQLAFYLQDEIYFMDNFKLTGGIRAEIPVILDDPTTNQNFNQQYSEFGVATNELPKARLMLSPRVGFNWQISKEQSSQLRGGIGMFISRIPFVWFANQFAQTGVELATIRLVGRNVPNDLKFSSDPFSQPDASKLGITETSEINVTDPDFKYPKIARLNLGYDRQLPWWGLIGTVEFIYSRRIHDVDYKNLNLLPSVQTLEGADNRPYFSDTVFSENYTSVILLTNTHKGHAVNFTFQIQKPPQEGLTGALSYNFGLSKDVNSGASSMAGANWGFVEQVYGPNQLGLSTSRYDVRSRITGFLQYQKNLGKNLTGSAALFYNGQSGLGVSFIYDEDINGDGEINDLIFVPADASDITFFSGVQSTPEEQWAALDKFIKNDSYLNSRRGSYAERNGKRMPFEHHFDLKIMQEFQLKIGKKRNRIQLSFDIFNVANLLNKKWGKAFSVRQQRIELINYTGGDTTPVYFFNTSGPEEDEDFWIFRPELGRWRGQLGIRYIFE